MPKQKWRPIPGCSNYAIGSHGDVKRLKHKANGKRHKILSEKILELNMNRTKNVYVNIIDDNGKQKVLSVQKLVMDTFLEKGHIYYKVVPEIGYVQKIDKETKEKKIVQIFNNRIDQFVRKDIYDRMTYKPTIYKTINHSGKSA